MSLALAALLWSSGCSSEASQCGTSADCEEGQICDEGVCVFPGENTCTGDPDCPGGFVCRGETCVRREDPDMGEEDATDPPEDMDTEEDMTEEEDMNFDNIPPEVVSVTPADGTTDVALDAAVEVVFNEDMRETSINPTSIEILDPENQRIDSTVDYDTNTRTATVTPSADLRQASGYRIRVTTFVRDEASNQLPDAVEAHFFTVFEEPMALTQIAEEYAPVIYQSITSFDAGDVNADIPTRVDFDGDFKARNNKATASQSSTKTSATVYYNVIESKTHYFLSYTLYYPMRWEDAGQSNERVLEHDFTGVVVVVEKSSGDVKLTEGIRIQSGTDAQFGFTPDGSGIGDTGAGINLDSYDAALLEDGKRFPLFVTGGVHEACNWYLDGSTFPPFCLHEAQEFSDGPTAGVVMRPGDAQTIDDATDTDSDNIEEMTYELVPLASTLWARRIQIGQEKLWERDFTYSPLGTDRPTQASNGTATVKLPGNLESDDDDSLGKPPFAWFKLSGAQNAGQWLLDPAFLLTKRYTFESADYSQDYCYNPFFAIDLRDDANTPDCATQ